MALPGFLLSALTGLMLFAVVFLTAPDATAQVTDPCVRADELLATRGVGDPDQDGLSSCRERKVTQTSPRNDDSDDDGIEDGAEIDDGTDPLDTDSDDDGLSDGDEDLAETDPDDPDSDDDGTPDGADSDPDDELGNRIEGDALTILCPAGGLDGSITLLGSAITLNASTEYEGVESCTDLEARIAANGSAHLEANVADDGAGGLVADELELEDADNDGSPDEIDPDDDNDGIGDDDDDDDDNDGVDDDLDDDELDD